MGEIIYAVSFGAWMVFLGAFMNFFLTREEHRYREQKNDHSACSEKGDS